MDPSSDAALFGELWPTERPPGNGPSHDIERAVMYGHHDILHQLLGDMSKEPDFDDFFVDTVDFQGMTLVHQAVVFCDPKAVSMLIQQGGGACVQQRDRYNMTPIDRAYESWETAFARSALCCLHEPTPLCMASPRIAPFRCQCVTLV